MWILALILGTIAFFLVAVMFIAELIKVRKALEHIAYSDRFQIVAKVDAGLMRENAATAREPLPDAGETGFEERLRNHGMASSGGYAADMPGRDERRDSDKGFRPEPEAEPEPEVHEYHKTKINVIAEEE